MRIPSEDVTMLVQKYCGVLSLVQAAPASTDLYIAPLASEANKVEQSLEQLTPVQYPEMVGADIITAQLRPPLTDRYIALGEFDVATQTVPSDDPEMPFQFTDGEFDSRLQVAP
jgi:hypothetical protein